MTRGSAAGTAAGKIEDWWIEAARNQVLPLDNRAFSSWVTGRPGAASARPRQRYVYYPQMAQIPEVSRQRPRPVAPGGG